MSVGFIESEVDGESHNGLDQDVVMHDDAVVAVREEDERTLGGANLHNNEQQRLDADGRALLQSGLVHTRL